MSRNPRRLLFGGYAPVHFLCFRPVYEILRRHPEIELWLTGGYRRQREGQSWFEIEGFYDGFDVDRERVLPFEEASEQEFDVSICAHTSTSLLPRRPGRSVQVFHGVSFKNFAVREKVLQYDVICVPGAYHAERFRQEGLLGRGPSTFLLTGFAKADQLVAPGFDREAYLGGLGVDASRPVVLFAPTGGKHNALETVGEEVIRAIAADGRWCLLIKPHDHPKRAIDWFSRLAPLESDRVRLIRDPDVVSPLRAADLLLTDASSVAVEYTLLDRPMVFIDVPRLLRNAIKRGAPLDLETYGRRIGRVARTPAEVLDSIQEGLEAPAAASALRRAAAARVFHEPGGASERIARVVLWCAGLQDGPPADVEVLEA